MDGPKCVTEESFVLATAALMDHDYVVLFPKENALVVTESSALQPPDDASSTSGYASDSSSISPCTPVSSVSVDSENLRQRDSVGVACVATASPKKVDRKPTMLERKFNSLSKDLWWQRKNSCHRIETNFKTVAAEIPLKCKENITIKASRMVAKQNMEKPPNAAILEPNSASSKIDETINSVVATVGSNDFGGSHLLSVAKDRRQLEPVTIMDVLLASNNQSAINLANSLQLQQIGTIPLPPNFNWSNFLEFNVASFDIPLSSLTGSASNLSVAAAGTSNSDVVSQRTVAVQTDEPIPLQKFDAESDSEDEGTCCHRLAPFPKRRKVDEEIEEHSEFYFDSHTAAATSSSYPARCRPYDWAETQICARVRPFIGRRIYLRPEDSCARTRAVDRKWRKEFNWFYSLGHPARALPHIPRLNRRSFKRLMIENSKANGFRLNYDEFATANRESLTGCAKEITEAQLIFASELTPSDQYANYKEERIWPYAVRCGLSKIHGVGCFATCDIPAKAVFLEYYGELIRNTLCDVREGKYGKQNGLARMYVNMFTLDADYTIDATMKGCVARFINHSCAPNATAKVITYERQKRLVLIAKRPIFAGEEICYDYKLPSEPENRIPCFCNAAKCRGQRSISSFTSSICSTLFVENSYNSYVQHPGAAEPANHYDFDQRESQRNCQQRSGQRKQSLINMPSKNFNLFAHLEEFQNDMNLK